MLLAVHYRVMEHLRSLESAQEARVALGYASGNSYASFVLSKLPFQFQEKEKTNSGYKHNNKVSHGIFNLTFRMLQHTSSEVTVTKYDEI